MSRCAKTQLTRPSAIVMVFIAVVVVSILKALPLFSCFFVGIGGGVSPLKVYLVALPSRRSACVKLVTGWGAMPSVLLVKDGGKSG